MFRFCIASPLRVAATQTARSRIPVRYLSASLTIRTNNVPWFITPEHEEFDEEDLTPKAPVKAPPIPEDVPEHIRELHTALSTSPYLDRSQLLVTRPIAPLPAPPAPPRPVHGRRRRRGGNDFGEGIDGLDMSTMGIWNWYVLAQVKAGTEIKGAINNVLKDIRQKLREMAKSGATVYVPPNRRLLSTEGWEMLVIGDFAVHILSREAREKFFPTQE